VRKVLLIMTASIDGYVVGPEGNAVGAMAEPPELKLWKLNRILRAGTHIMGRVTYDEMASFWPTSKDPFAEPMNDVPKVVFSKSIKKAEWPESRIASGDLADEIAKLRKERGGEIIAWGGARFAQSLARADLIDEYAIITSPVVHGAGKPLFLDLPESRQLDVLGSTHFEGGVALRLYQPHRGKSKKC
jgi:dihydrofolate reductase